MVNKLLERLENLNLALEIHEEIAFLIRESKSISQCDEMSVMLEEFEDENLIVFFND